MTPLIFGGKPFVQIHLCHREGGYFHRLVVVFCSTPDEPHYKKGWPFSGPIIGTSYGHGTKIVTGKRSPFFPIPPHFLEIPVFLMRPKGYSILRV